MAIPAQKSQNTDRELAPKGRHQAVLIGIKDEGMHPNSFKEGNPLEAKLSFVFEIAALNQKGEPHSFSLWKTNSSWYSQKTGKMSGLIEMLTLWLDVKASELTPPLLDDLELLCGLNARVRLSHEPKQDGSGDKVKMTSIEPWEDGDGELLEPQREWGDSGFFPAKTVTQFWDHVKSGIATPAVAKAAAPSQKAAPSQLTAPIEATEGELPITSGQLGRSQTLARQKFGDDYSEALAEMVMDGFGKKRSLLSQDEGEALIKKLTALPNFEVDAEDDDSVFDFDPDTAMNSAQLLQDAAAPTPSPQSAKTRRKVESEAY